MSKENRKATLRKSSGNVTINKFYRSWEKAPDNVKEVGRCDDGQYEVEEILQIRHTKDGSPRYLVKWAGWAESYNSFVTEEEAGDCKGKIKAFIKNLISLRDVPGEENDEEFRLFKKSLEETDEEEQQEEEIKQDNDESQPELDSTANTEKIETDDDEETEVIEMEENEEDDDGNESKGDADHGNGTPSSPVFQVISEPSLELIEMLKRLKVIPE